MTCRLTEHTETDCEAMYRATECWQDFTLEEGNEEYQEREVLLQLFREFALDMNRGRYLTLHMTVRGRNGFVCAQHAFCILYM